MNGGRQPNVIVVGGPNGAGKSTFAPVLLSFSEGPIHFVNADVIAQGLSAFQPESQALAAGRIMLTRLRELAAERADFAFETTLSSRTFAPWISELRREGYSFSLTFLALPSADLAVSRVAHRVRTGGHHVPESDVRRRYDRGLWNLFNIYLPLADRWLVYNGAVRRGRRLIAAGIQGAVPVVAEQEIWQSLEERYDGAKPKNGKYANIADLLADPEAVEAALNRASEAAVLRHQQLGQDVVVWQDGKVVVLSGKELDVAVASPNEDHPSSSAA